MSTEQQSASVYDKMSYTRSTSEIFQRLQNLEDSLKETLTNIKGMKGELYRLEANVRGETLERIDKPWGHEEVLERNAKYAMKTLHIRAGEELSLQYHEVKHETIYCVSGKGSIMVDGNITGLAPGVHVVVPPTAQHKIRAVDDMILIEASTPELEDVIRIKDKHGRPTELL